MKKIFILICSMILFTGCFTDSDEFIVVDKQMQDPISIFETSDEKPEGYTRTIPRLYIITVKNLSTEERESFVIDKTEYFKLELGSDVSSDQVDKFRVNNK